MKFFFLSIIILSFFFTTPKQTSDSLYFEQKISELKKEIISADNLRKETEILNDSLKEELLLSKIKEDHYTTGLASQTAIFSAIAAGLFLAFGGLSYFGFQHETKKYKDFTEENVEKINKAFQKSKKNLQNLEKDYFRSEGNLFASIGIMMKEKNLKGEAFFYFISAARRHVEHFDHPVWTKKSREKKRATKYESAIGCLDVAIELGKDLLKKEDVKASINITQLEENIQKISQSPHKTVQEKTFELISVYHQIKHKFGNKEDIPLNDDSAST